MKRIFLLTMLLTSAAGAQTTIDEDAVMKAAVRQHFTVHQPFLRGHVVLAPQAGGDAVPQSAIFTDAKMTKEVRDQVAADFAERNASSRTVAFDLPDGVVFGTSATQPEIVASATVSRPGFSADGSLAVVRIGIQRSKLTYSAAYVFARQADGSWKNVAGVTPAEAGDPLPAS